MDKNEKNISKITLERGFTLVEISIVLVIIGFIVGGIVVGGELIRAAGLRKTISDVETYSIAVNVFRNKYHCLPGDCVNATQFGFGSTSNSNGDGNGLVNSWEWMYGPGNGVQAKESMNLWAHLSSAGLIKGTYSIYSGYTTLSGIASDYVPSTVAGRESNILGFSIYSTIGDSSLGNSWAIGKLLIDNANHNNNGIYHSLTAYQAQYIDTKIDDGLPITGRIRTLYPYSGPRVTGDYSGCLIGGANVVYDVQGLWRSYGGAQANSLPNPDQIGCAISIGNAW